ncbi:hypothetical protein F8M41_014175 [Gigaspora margarita]|uniref:Uncharacterized protein n=1 Tax=Gigaspora margarita TaxID=4874 RepID=A0A8H3WXR4_GIGMA|nr:hypothetical protein F8M41_014175 [Gigaspora margarita]
MCLNSFIIITTSYLTFYYNDIFLKIVKSSYYCAAESYPPIDFEVLPTRVQKLNQVLLLITMNRTKSAYIICATNITSNVGAMRSDIPMV